jgi:hypothetical protein
MENEHRDSFSHCIYDDDDGRNLHGALVGINVSVTLDDVSIVMPAIKEDA